MISKQKFWSGQAINEDPREYCLEDAICCWKVMNYIIDQYQQKFPHWLFMRHEDLSNNFIKGFKKIYSAFGLNWSNYVCERIEEHCQSGNLKDPKTCVHILKRDSQSTTRLWKSILSQDEIDSIYLSTKSIASKFYSDEDWDQ